ncbi:MAG TPA: TetR/AcrR family transcriptional regulator [Pseudorhodoplanes sp.]|jgi:TetR/AcrR family transcriptional regulator|nr:TetR/AcrR family transcriptional regulator [Pseudorhodoplanes sp.]
MPKSVKGKVKPQRDAERTKALILDAATKEFASKGYSNAFVDAIAARTHVNKRMIYYYFGSKRDLYVAVLKNEYAKLRAAEQKLDLDHLPPVEALKHYAEFAFDYYRENEQFVHLVSLENVMKGRFLSATKSFQAMNTPIIDLLRRILKRGAAEKKFRSDIDPLDLHLTLSALGFFHISNRYTFGATFSYDMTSPKSFERRKKVVVDTVMRYVCL